MPAETTEDGHWIVVDGRRWRATDPSIPEAFRKELVGELMAARRAVGEGRRSGDDSAVIAARERVGDAKHALGERGEPSWEEPTREGTDARVRAAILALARHRAPKSLCPSDAARAVGGAGWRSVMPVARSIAVDLQRSGVIEVTQRGAVVDPDDHVRGPIRLRLSGAPSSRTAGGSRSTPR